MRSTQARPFIAFDDVEDRYLPEGPKSLTVDGREAVAWVNIQTSAESKRGALHLRFWDDGEHGTWNLSGRPGFLLPTDRPGTLFLGMDKRVGLLDLATNEFRALAAIPDDSPRTTINDGQVVPGGKAVVFGTKDTAFEDSIAALYLYTLADGKLSVLADRQTCSNGKVFAADDRGLLLYDIDTPTRRVARYRFDLASRAAAFDATAVDLSGVDGFPDGMSDAGDGTAIVAFYNPARQPHGRAVRYDLKTGTALEEWTTPAAPRVTCPLIVRRPEGVMLILTTATEGMSADDFDACPGSGNLFLADLGAADCPMAEVVRIEESQA